MGAGVRQRARFELTGGASAVASIRFHIDTPVWGSPKKPGEDYPNRLHTRPLVTLDEPEYLDAFELARRLEYAQKWGDHISLAFQGNIRAIPKGDYDQIVDEMEHAQRAVSRQA